MRFPLRVLDVFRNTESLLPTETILAPAPTPVPTRKRIVCECCECELTPTGDAIAISDKFRAFRTLQDKIDALKAELEKAQTDLSAMTRERDDARSQIPKKSSLW